MSKWEEFVELYSDENVSSGEIREKLGLGKSAYYNWGRDFANEYGFMRKTGKRGLETKVKFKQTPPKKCKEPLNYYYMKYANSWRVSKQIDGKPIDYGCYKNKEQAEKVVEHLKKHNWDKESLKELRL